eukprot:TRINITY_DN4667_c0_g1_i1.p1 TRINITY_DN4667_c0_g1~~TRINITY_DN4667_c0_g1_i1.p1  ORF type:complete len:569 (+),score=125.32 TRINITY_DN4667_c0_g1_i1:26-1732(+)
MLQTVLSRAQWQLRARQIRHASSALKPKYDVIVIGGGHNGLTSAAYCAKNGLDVLVLERNHWLGGAATTQELVPGFKFSRASYLAGLLRPQIIQDLELEQYGFKYLPRNPSSFTPGERGTPYEGKSLTFWDDGEATKQSIAQFSQRDAERFAAYEHLLDSMREVIQPLIDNAPPSFDHKDNTWSDIRTIMELGGKAMAHKDQLASFYEILTSPASHLLDRWFESDILKTTLATDAVIGSMASPSDPGSGYVLLHHVMGEAAGKKGVWAYVEGGMGAISDSIAQSARHHGATLVTDANVHAIDTLGKRAVGVDVTVNGERIQIQAPVIMANCNPYHLFVDLLKDAHAFIDPSCLQHIRAADYSCGAFKINCAVAELPDFLVQPNVNGQAGPHHRGTIHFENSMAQIEAAAAEAKQGRPATRPVIEMTIPSVVDPSIAPAGKHVVQLFVQYAPYDLKVGSWADPAFKQAFVDRVFAIVDSFAPNFSRSVIGYDALSPLDLEQVFGLHKGNIFHGALGLHQLAFMRPAPGYSSYSMPLQGLYFCGSGASPGGGVMGAPGRNAAMKVLKDWK